MRSLISIVQRHAAVLILAFVLVAITGLYSVHLGVSEMWDIRNYHLYNPFALLGGRYMSDVAPAQLQTYFNPTIDVPFYLLVKWANDWPRLIAFLIGALHGLNLLCVVLLAWQLLGSIEGMSQVLRFILAAIALVISATGAGSVSLIGVWTGDLQDSLPVLAALLFAVYAIDRAQDDREGSLKLLVLSGFLGGLAAGLKLTMALYGVALAASLMTLPRGVLFGGILRLGAGGVLGALLAGGPHHFTMWRLFGNPFFPIYNDTFPSPYAQQVSFVARGRIPTTLFEWFFYPFEWAFQDIPGFMAQVEFRDMRIAAAISVGVLMALAWLVARLTRYRGRAPTSRGFLALVIFMVVAYVLWLSMFSIYRYVLPLEMLSGVFIVVGIGQLARREAWPIVAAATAVLCILTTKTVDWGRAPYQKRYIDVTAPQLAPDTLIVIMGGDPVGYYAPFIDKNVRWVRVLSNFLRLEGDNELTRHAAKFIREHRGPLMLLRAGATDAEAAKTFSRYSLTRTSGDCAPLYGSLGLERYELCPIEVMTP